LQVMGRHQAALSAGQPTRVPSGVVLPEVIMSRQAELSPCGKAPLSARIQALLPEEGT
jgi:hypothetical protein